MQQLLASFNTDRMLSLALVFCAFLLFLWGPPLFDLDEGAFSAATSEMLRRGDFITTWLNGEPRFDKPILIYWLQALSVSLGGRDEFFFRLPSALAASAWGLSLYYFARQRLGEEAEGKTLCEVETGQQRQRHRVDLERGPDLAAEELARLHRQRSAPQSSRATPGRSPRGAGG